MKKRPCFWYISGCNCSRFWQIIRTSKTFKLTCWTYSVLKMKHVKYHLVLLYYCVKIWKKSQYEGPWFFVQHDSVTKTVKTNLLGGNDLFKRLLINFWNVCCFYHAERKSFPYRMFSFHFLLKRGQTFLKNCILAS